MNSKKELESECPLSFWKVRDTVGRSPWGSDVKEVWGEEVPEDDLMEYTGSFMRREPWRENKYYVKNETQQLKTQWALIYHDYCYFTQM